MPTSEGVEHTMNVTDAVRRRKSIRAFLDTPVDDAVIAELLATASWSPSGGNVQPWRVYVVNGDGLLEIRSVEVSHSSPDFAVIDNGLNAGDQVIISTIRNPLPGMALQASESTNRGMVSTEKNDDGRG